MGGRLKWKETRFAVRIESNKSFRSWSAETEGTLRCVSCVLPFSRGMTTREAVVSKGNLGNIHRIFVLSRHIKERLSHNVMSQVKNPVIGPKKWYVMGNIFRVSFLTG